MSLGEELFAEGGVIEEGKWHDRTFKSHFAGTSPRYVEQHCRSLREEVPEEGGQPSSGESNLIKLQWSDPFPKGLFVHVRKTAKVGLCGLKSSRSIVNQLFAFSIDDSKDEVVGKVLTIQHAGYLLASAMRVKLDKPGTCDRVHQPP